MASLHYSVLLLGIRALTYSFVLLLNLLLNDERHTLCDLLF